MARARNIKPSFFNNDVLAECDPLGRLLFIGLWTIADFKGDIEWRPKRIKAQILPYDNCDIEKLAINLDKSGFIRFYSVQGEDYLNIVNFNKHQNPHKNERDKGSEIPAFGCEGSQAIDLKELAINPDKSRSKRNDSTSDRADSLIPITDSLILNPDSYFPQTESQTDAKAPNTVSAQVNEIFEYWKATMNKNESSKLTKERDKKVRERLKEGYTVDQIKLAVFGCSQSPHNMGQNENGKVYDDLELICRTGSNLERFAGYSHPVPMQEFSNVTASNIEMMRDWTPDGGDL
jgi:hypothetical protein